MKKHALIISAGAYQDAEKLKPLKKTTADANGLAEVLRRADFSVVTLIDKNFREVNTTVLKFYRKREADDLLLLYFCGHGVRNVDGHLYLALVDSEFEALEASALDCKALRTYMNNSRSKQQLLILDCCYSGAFDDARNGAVNFNLADLAPDSNANFDVGKQEGRFVLTATDKNSLALEKAETAPASPYSLFTQSVIDGFSSKTTRDAAGNITVHKLRKYTQQKVEKLSDGKQSPQLISYVGDGDLLLVKSQYRPLPEEIEKLLTDDWPNNRLSAVTQIKHACELEPLLIPAAVVALKSLRTDRDYYVSKEAAELLKKLVPPQEPKPPQPIKAETQNTTSKDNSGSSNEKTQPTKTHTQRQEKAKAQSAKNTTGTGSAKLWKVVSASLSAAVLLGLTWVFSPSRTSVSGDDTPKAALGVVIVATPAVISTSKPTPKPTKVITPTPKPRAADIAGEVLEQDKLKSGGLAPKMVVIPAGEFLMGFPKSELGRDNDEGPQRKVKVKAFAMGQSEVSVAEFKQFVDATGHTTTAETLDSGKLRGCWAWGKSDWSYQSAVNWRGPGFKQGADYPVVCVSWRDASAYVTWLKEQTGKDYRLPSEAEWEYAARAGTSTAFYTGECISATQANFYDKEKKTNGEQAAYGDCPSSEKYEGQTVAVKSYRPNAFGLYDMHGNVWEWTEDCWHSSYDGAPDDGSAWIDSDGADCAYRVLRGGGWHDDPVYLRSASRDGDGPVERSDDSGFRLARTLY